MRTEGRQRARRESAKRQHRSVMSSNSQALADAGLKGKIRDRSGPSRAEYEARLAEIPEDTRSTTGAAFGDPLPGRSALDRMRKEGRSL